MLGFASNFVIAWAFVGGTIAAVFGARMWAAYLISPAVIRFLVWPLASPLLSALLSSALAHWWWFIPLFLVAPVIIVVLGLQMWVSLLRALFGVAGAHAGGIHISRFLDWLFGRRYGRPIPKWEQDENE